MKGIWVRTRKILSWSMFGFFFFGILCMSSAPATAAEKEKAQAIVDKAKGTLADFMNDSTFSWLSNYLAGAKGVVIFPQVVKGGFFIGGSGGTGVLLVRQSETDNWSEPAFYTLGSVTFGLQIGGEAAEIIMVATSQKAVDTLLSSSVKLGGDASITAGPIGGGAKGGVGVPSVTADFVSFARSKGLYAGLNLEGAVMAVRDGLNQGYYDRAVRPSDIVVKDEVSNPDANELRAAVSKAASIKNRK
ncbi:MAG TPA: lipid-binding SYLF domain-containing protein [Geobacteraceae bacterium]|nr:lipid-binding SYLF domain-containing protein [Geobacteraceae bacterium]